MRRSSALLVLVISLFFILPGAAFAQNNKIEFKYGNFIPAGDLGGDDWDNGTGGEVSYTFMTMPKVGIQGSFGRYTTEFEEGYASATMTVTPLTVSVLGFMNADRFHLYGGGGVGYYFAKFDYDQDFTDYSDSGEDKVFGYHLMVGMEFDVTDTFLVGLEGKLVQTGKARFKVKVDAGYTETYEANLDGNLYMAKARLPFLSFRFKGLRLI